MQQKFGRFGIHIGKYGENVPLLNPYYKNIYNALLCISSTLFNLTYQMEIAGDCLSNFLEK